MQNTLQLKFYIELTRRPKKLTRVNFSMIYYKEVDNRLPTMLISIHYYLQHIANCIADCSPCWTFWQYPMEHLCGLSIF